MNSVKSAFCFTLLLLLVATAQAQMVTGVWHGKINGQKTEVKIIKSGDSITGTSYYYASQNAYRRYSIKGYFDEESNEVVWWDDQLIEEKVGGLMGTPGRVPLLSRADFNCPGGGVMKLDGSSNEKREDIREGQVHLEKTYKGPVFTDEWDWVIDNFTIGANDPYLIDSISLIAFHPDRPVRQAEEPLFARNKKKEMVFVPAPQKTQAAPQPVVIIPPVVTIEQKFTARKKKLVTTLPVTGDSILLQFYDNAIVDGDSISLFLDDQLIFSHIKLTDKPYTVKLAVADLRDESELVMVAENLGAIPPNTSYLVAVMGDKRYTANLSSTEDSSAVIRLKRPVK